MFLCQIGRRFGGFLAHTGELPYYCFQARNGFCQIGRRLVLPSLLVGVNHLGSVAS